MRFATLSLMLVLTACTPGYTYQTSSEDVSKTRGFALNGVIHNCPPRPRPEALVLKPFPVERDLSVERLVNVVRPVFPRCAQLMHVAGTVDVQFTLQPDGSVHDIKLLQEVPAGFGFADNAMAVFGQWKFKPRIVDGKAVSSTEYYRFTFKF